MDEIDRAQAMETAEREAGLARRRRAISDEARAVGRDDCADCGEPIAPGRRAAVPGAVRCGPCARDMEVRR